MAEEGDEDKKKDDGSEDAAGKPDAPEQPKPDDEPEYPEVDDHQIIPGFYLGGGQHQHEEGAGEDPMGGIDWSAPLEPDDATPEKFEGGLADALEEMDAIREEQEEHINGWLEDMLVAAKRGEIYEAVSKAYAETPDDEKEAFIRSIDPEVVWYIARDANYMNFVLMGEEISRTDLQPYNDSRMAMAEDEGKAHLVRDERLRVQNPAYKFLSWRHDLNHPEQTGPLRQYTDDPKARNVGRCPRIGPRVFIAERNRLLAILDEPASISLEDHQAMERKDKYDRTLLHVSELKDRVLGLHAIHDRDLQPHFIGDANDTSNNKETARHTDYDKPVKIDLFEDALNRASCFREIRVGALARAIGETHSWIASGQRNSRHTDKFFGDRWLYDSLTNRRRQLVHHFQQFRGETDVFSRAAERDITITQVIEGLLKERDVPYPEERVAGIPSSEKVLSDLRDRMVSVEHDMSMMNMSAKPYNLAPESQLAADKERVVQAYHAREHDNGRE